MALTPFLTLRLVGPPPPTPPSSWMIVTPPSLPIVAPRAEDKGDSSPEAGQPYLVAEERTVSDLMPRIASATAPVIGRRDSSASSKPLGSPAKVGSGGSGLTAASTMPAA